MSAYERDRQRNIERNQVLIKELGLQHADDAEPKAKPPPQKRRKLSPIAPTRISARIASAPKPRYTSPPLLNSSGRRSRAASREPRGFDRGRPRPRLEKSPSEASRSLSPPDDLDSLRAGWTSWQPEAPIPERDEYGTLQFESHPSFRPNKTPAEVLQEGAFGGCYYRPYRSLKLGIVIRDDWKELPSEWLEGLDVSRFLTGGDAGDFDPAANKYAVKAGQSLEDWEKAGWMDHRYDVRGWFQWYTRFYMGRRCPDDERQVSRWERCVGKKGRWRRTLLKQYLRRGVKSVNDEEGGEGGEAGEVSPIVSQTCLQWAYEVKQDEVDNIWENGL